MFVLKKWMYRKSNRIRLRLRSSIQESVELTYMNIWTDRFFIPTETEHVYSGQKAPVTLGHEFAGEIVEVGSAVTRVKVGDRVTVEPILAKHNLVGD